MRVRVIVSGPNTSWIIGKMSERLVENLVEAGVDAILGPEPDDDADVNHWMSFSMVSRRAGRVSTLFITHMDDPYKTTHVARSLAKYVDLGLCMSPDMMRALIKWGLPADRLWYVLPALDQPHDPARIRIAIATRLYPDGRKRQSMLLKLAAERDLSPFHFEISGIGWDILVPKLREAGASVNWYPGSTDYQADYRALLQSMRGCEYYLYLGMDEGSLGTLDALALGLKTIITPQGFHLDLKDGITEPVLTEEEVLEAFDRLAGEREKRLASIRDWTWKQNASDHLLVWDALMHGRRADLATVLAGQGRYGENAGGPFPAGLSTRTWSNYYGRSLQPSHIVDGLATARLLMPVRRLMQHMGLLQPLARLLGR